MAYYGIQSAGQALTASTAADTISIAYAPTAAFTSNSVLGLAGNDLIYLGPQGLTAIASATQGISGYASGVLTLVASAGNTYTTSYSGSGAGAAVTGVVTSTRGARQLVGSVFYGNEGDDTIALGNQVTTISASTIGGGAGDDLIGSYTWIGGVFTSNSVLVTANGGIGTALTVTKGFIEAGGGNDTISLVLSGGTLTSSTVQAGQGDDSIALVNTATGVTQSSLIAGGGGNDDISASISGGSAVSIVGGGGNDTISITAAIAGGVFSLGVINGDVNGQQDSQYDGADLISATLRAYSSTTIGGGGGNDTIILSGTDQGNNLIAGNLGDDSIDLGSLLSASTVQGGGGNDRVVLITGSNSSIIQLGGGNDVLASTIGVKLSGDIYSATTIYGGAGADEFLSGATLTGGQNIGTFGYSAAADSTLDTMDTIALGGAVASGSYLFRIDWATVTQGSFSASQATGSNGVVTFTAGFDTDVTSRANYINANMTTEGQSVLFKNGSNVNYLFIQGGASDQIVQVGTAGTSTNGTLTIAGGRTITINLT